MARANGVVPMSGLASLEDVDVEDVKDVRAIQTIIKETEETLHVIFEDLDLNHDGRLELEELKVLTLPTQTAT